MNSQTLSVRENLFRATYAINILGLVGSVLSFIIFSRKAFHTTSIGFYCKFLALFDQFTIFTMIIGVISEFTGFNLINAYSAVCKFLYYISFGISGIPGWIMALFSLDQYLTISWQNRFKFRQTRWFRYSLLAVVFLYHSLFYIQAIPDAYLKELTLVDNQSWSGCYANPATWIGIVYVVDNAVLPLAIMIVTTALVLRTMFVTRKKLFKNTAKTMPHLGGGSGNTSTPHESISIRDVKFAFNSVVLNLVFFIFMLPTFSTFFFIPNENDLTPLIQPIASFFFYINFASHFWIYLSVNSVFRNELFVLFRLRKK